MLGKASQVKVDKENTTIVGGAGSKPKILMRVLPPFTGTDRRDYFRLRP